MIGKLNHKDITEKIIGASFEVKIFWKWLPGSDLPKDPGI